MVKSIKKFVSPVEEPITNYVSVELMMGITVDLKHVSGDEDKTLQVSSEADGLGVKWNDLSATASSTLKTLFTV